MTLLWATLVEFRYHNAVDCCCMGCGSDSAGWEAAHLLPDPQLLSPGGWVDDMWICRSCNVLGDLAPCHSHVQSASTILK